MKIENTTPLLFEIKNLITESKQQVATAVNASITILYWHVGKRINDEILKEQRAEYGKKIIETLSHQLSTEYGNGWSTKHLRHCMQFAQVFPALEIVSTLWRQFSWSHLKEVIYFEDDLQRTFYIEMCKLEKWSVRTFRERINSLLHERTAISKKPEETIKNELALLKNEQKLTADLVFRDPYFLDFLNLKDTYSEKDLESSILAEIQRFIIEMGSDFAFLAKQKRLMIDNRDYYIDLLFYHRRLKALVAIDLKLGEFDAAHKGEMELYLNYLDKYEKVEGENNLIGLILCTGKNQEHIELMQLNKTNIKVAEYLTLLPSKEILLEKLHKAIEIAKNRIDNE